MRSVLLGLGLALALPPTAATSQELRLTVGPRVVQERASEARGYPAFPVTLLGQLGGEIEEARGTVSVRLFGDTLSFREGFADFRVNGTAVPLTHWSFARNGVLFLPIRFYTDWLPARYPARLRYANGTLTLIPGLAAAASVTRPRPSSARDTSMRPSRGAADPVPRGASPPDPPAPRSGDASAPSSRGRSSDRDPDALPPGSLRGFIDTRVFGVFDSNIDHQADPRSSYGTVGRLGMGIQSARSDPALTVRYDLGYYRFTNSERWNRATHDVRVEVAPSLGALRPRLRGTVRVGSWTEDRELANQLVLRPGLDFRPNRSVLVSLYGEHRVRRISGTVERSDTNRLVGVSLARRWRGGGRWEIEGRYEDNHSERPSNRYTGWSGRAMLRLPFAGAERAALELSHRQRRFAERLVEVNGAEVPRHDRRWTPGLVLTHEFAGGYWSLDLEYELEHNRSNDLDSAYLAHRVGLGVRRRW